jgi:hypothetical protein
VAGDGVGAVMSLAVAVWVAEQVEFVDVELGEAVAELGMSQCGERGGRPGVRVAGVVLAEGGGDDHDAIAAVAGLGHQAGVR